MIARAVIGANFGDEGKGLVTDWLCMHGAGIVVRFNGGAQAGHTVVHEDGRRHVFSHFGSGTLRGVPTYLSKYFVVNPIAYFREKEELTTLGITPLVFAHPECTVTTFVDMFINQELETRRGKDRHGSVGLGVNETVERSMLPELKITMADLWNNSKSLESKLVDMCSTYSTFRIGSPIGNPDNMIHAFLQGCSQIANEIHPLGISQCKDPVFEGAQGLLLDQNNKEFFPHLTRSNTGSHNVQALCTQAGIKDIETYYVSRTYLTRHGAGPLPGENANLSYPDNTNLKHQFQGTLRFAPLDYPALLERIKKDNTWGTSKLVLTHMDQLPPEVPADLYAWGPNWKWITKPGKALNRACIKYRP
ncbi:MAG TPA: adenylosuccinate synthetase [Bacteroidia bacterium]|jgi:adenylosuccinate synthase|nr:adenylosuccinate synthetase [Bacteroidia bacterium]